MKFLLSTAYFGPLQYYSKLEMADEILLEKYEHFPKQTYRNRCVIYGANGSQTLTVPITKGDSLKIYTKDVCIDYSMNWQNNHLKAIESAYGCSPFYLYYIDEILPLLQKKHVFLYDLNLEVTTSICHILGIKIHLKETQEYLKIVPQEYHDFRDSIHPKPRMSAVDNSFTAPVYRQVFEPKLGFIHNLSIIDLIFNEGPEAIQLLRKSNRYKRPPLTRRPQP